MCSFIGSSDMHFWFYSPSLYLSLSLYLSPSLSMMISVAVGAMYEALKTVVPSVFTEEREVMSTSPTSSGRCSVITE
jgi:hypothetical protein